MHGRILVINKEEGARQHFSEDEMFENWMERYDVDYVREMTGSQFEEEVEYFLSGMEKDFDPKQFHRWNSEQYNGFTTSYELTREVYDQKMDKLAEIMADVISVDDFIRDAWKIKETVSNSHGLFIADDFWVVPFDEWLQTLDKAPTNYEITQVFDYHF